MILEKKEILEENLKTRWKLSVVLSPPFRNSTLVIALKKYAKADIKILINFFRDYMTQHFHDMNQIFATFALREF